MLWLRTTLDTEHWEKEQEEKEEEEEKEENSKEGLAEVLPHSFRVV